MDSTGQIGVEEYRARQAALRALARDRGLDVVVAWSRGGARRIAGPGLGGAQYEDNLLIGSTGAELLTPARSEYRHR
jgi:hypothetical protein